MSFSINGKRSRRAHPSRQGGILPGLMACLAIALGVILFLPYAPDTPLETITRVAGVLVAMLLVINVRHSPKGVYSVSSIYLFVLAAFHFGLVIPYGLGLVGPNSYFEEYLLSWFETPSTSIAIVLAVAAAAGFVAGKLLATLRGFPVRLPDQEDAENREMFAGAGAVVLLIGCATWFFVVAVLAEIDILGSYEGFYTGIIDFNIVHVHNLIAVAAIVTLIGPHSTLKTTALVVFGIWAIAIMAAGNRGEILFPIAGIVAVLGMEKPLLSPAKALIGVVLLLGLIAVIREVRTIGVRHADQVVVSANPIEGLLELGSSIRPVREAVLWIEGGDSHSWGASFWAPFDRALYYVIPGWTRPPATLDERLMGNLVEQRVGAIGFSAVAEGYYNFGPWGLALEFMMLGFLFGRMDFWPARPYEQAVVGVCLIPLLTHVRNTFTGQPAQILIGIVFIHFLYFLAKTLRAEQRLSRSVRLKPVSLPSSPLKKRDRHLGAIDFCGNFANQVGASPLCQRAASRVERGS